MTIEQRGKKFRIKQMVDGHMYTVTLDHRPKKAEAQALIEAQIRKEPKNCANMTLLGACHAYNKAKSNIISPATIVGYESTIRNIPEKYGKMHIASFTSANLQELTNELSASVSPKTVKNRIGYIYTVLKYHDIELRQPTTPQNIKKAPYIPTSDDITQILAYLKPTRYWVGTMLGVFGLRRSEILALTLDDLNGNVLTVNKATVPSGTTSDSYVTKSTKTAASIRTIILPDSVVERINEQGYIYIGEPGGMYKALQRAQRDLGIPRFPFHKLRHFFASYAHQSGYTDKQIQEMGGWADGSRIMKMVYEHAMDMDNAKKSIADKLGNLG